MRSIVDAILDAVIDSPHESEVIEFKDRKNLNKDEMGEYFSALSNEAFLKGVEYAWMIFGMTDDGTVINSNFLDTVESQNRLKKYISEHTSGRMSYIDIHTRSIDGKRVLLFQIPPARDGTPTSFKTFAYERQGDSVFGLSDEKRLRIMHSSIPDWSRNILHGADVRDLDSAAISKARYYFKKYRPSKSDECDTWDDVTFLNKMGLTIDGKVTYAAVVLLGSPDMQYSIPGSALSMKWILRDDRRMTLDTESFTIPFILAMDDVCSKIRNVKYEYFRPGTLFPERMDTYEPSMLREILNNCIAHQDYRMYEHIVIVEYERDSLIFKNAGQFIPGSIEDVLARNAPASYYRNRTLAESMARLGMVDVAGGGIIRMFEHQRDRFFPMPEYDLSNKHVEVKITGRVIDSAFADVLMADTELDLEDVLILDKVQKGLSISDSDAKRLRGRGFLEGRRPNYRISVKSDSLENERAPKDGKEGVLTNEDYTKLIISHLVEHGSADKTAICDLFAGVLPPHLDENQKYNRVTNILRVMKNKGLIVNTGTTRKPVYVLPDGNRA
ncbi:MAG: putative DNA binding domain-containing protein [Candidatus Methanomethylophilaceae archaeon]|nr:putative DNA binding domain-containing protein [Candidatus Methanomethylophilaceae archaeon]